MATNGFINKKWLRSTDRKFIYQRSGKCNPKKCESACCRFDHVGHTDNNGQSMDYHKMNSFRHIRGVQTRVVNRITHYITPRLCPYIKIGGGCDLHGKRTQPTVCRDFPVTPTDGVYVACKHVCGYKFKKIRNPNYKKQKETEERTK